MIKKTLFLGLSTGLAFVLSGCAALKHAEHSEKTILTNSAYVSSKEAAIASPICQNLASPSFVSFKQLAYATAKREGREISEIVDFFYKNERFKNKAYASLLELKLDIEQRNGGIIDIKNYSSRTSPMVIHANGKELSRVFDALSGSYVSVKKGVYTLSDLLPFFKGKINLSVGKSLLEEKFEIRENYPTISLGVLLDIATESIARKHEYSVRIDGANVHIFGDESGLSIANVSWPVVEQMLRAKNIEHTKRDNKLLLKASLSNYLFAKSFLDTFSQTPDNLMFCVNHEQRDTYGAVQTDEKIVIADVGKISIQDLGYISNGTIRYALTVEDFSEQGNKETYLVSTKDNFIELLLNRNVTIRFNVY